MVSLPTLRQDSGVPIADAYEVEGDGNISGTTRTPEIHREKEHSMEYSTNEIRGTFAETLHRVRYGKERIALTRRGKVLALVLPVDDITSPHITGRTNSVDARDNISEVLNRVFFGKEVIGVERRGVTIAVMMSPVMFKEISLAPSADGFGDGPSTDDSRQPQRPKQTKKNKSGFVRNAQS
jgi:antitoxin (DNA-binding transcriptional repressor) of toxin-antitoxin stability system